MSEKQNRQLAIDEITMTFERRNPQPGLIDHSDQSLLYATSAYREILKAHRMISSMSRTRDCYDNACSEDFFSGLMNELIWDRDFRTC